MYTLACTHPLHQEHTWGLDTTFYLADYANWTNTQFRRALQLPNYRLTVESWLEQRSYISNAIALLGAQHSSFQRELTAALATLTPRALEAARATKLAQMVQVPSINTTSLFRCGKHGAVIAFAGDGSVNHLSVHGQTLVDRRSAARLGLLRYQTLSADNFSTFNSLYTGHCTGTNQSALETPGCHNFHKPNMSSAYGGDTSAGYGLHVPQMTKLFRAVDSCSFISEAKFAPILSETNGAPQRVIVSLSFTTDGEIDLNVSAINKTASRLAEATWVSFQPQVQSAEHWRLEYFGGDNTCPKSARKPSLVTPTNVVEHGAVHLHALGSDGALVYHVADEQTIKIQSLDVPVVSAGLISPFPTMADNSSGVPDNATARILGAIEASGWHYNLQNQIWNTNFPQWYPFDPADTEMLARFHIEF